jgi:hypothetical protein
VRFEDSSLRRIRGWGIIDHNYLKGGVRLRFEAAQCSPQTVRPFPGAQNNAESAIDNRIRQCFELCIHVRSILQELSGKIPWVHVLVALQIQKLQLERHAGTPYQTENCAMAIAGEWVATA